MDSKPHKEGTGAAPVAGGAFLAALACCALPLLVAAGGLGVVGTVAGSGWVIGVAVLLAASGAVWLLRRHGAGSNGDDCCAPEPSGRGESGQTPTHPTPTQER